jgi:hypothetical protein
MRHPTVIVQNRPAKESAHKAPIRGVKLDVPPKFVSVFEAATNGIFNSCVK